MYITNDKLMEILESTLGLPFGSQGITYIQDTGTKKKGRFYLSKTDSFIHECLIDDIETVYDVNKYKICNAKNSDEYFDGMLAAPKGRVKYIQDIGEKFSGCVYLDRNNWKMYLCESNTSTTTNDASYFTEYNFKQLVDSIQARADSAYNEYGSTGLPDFEEQWKQRGYWLSGPGKNVRTFLTNIRVLGISNMYAHACILKVYTTYDIIIFKAFCYYDLSEYISQTPSSNIWMGWRKTVSQDV